MMRDEWHLLARDREQALRALVGDRIAEVEKTIAEADPAAKNLARSLRRVFEWYADTLKDLTVASRPRECDDDEDLESLLAASVRLAQHANTEKEIEQ